MDGFIYLWIGTESKNPFVRRLARFVELLFTKDGWEEVLWPTICGLGLFLVVALEAIYVSMAIDSRLAGLVILPTPLWCAMLVFVCGLPAAASLAWGVTHLRNAYLGSVGRKPRVFWLKGE